MKILSFILGIISLFCLIVSSHMLVNDGPGPGGVHLFLVIMTFLTTSIYLSYGIYKMVEGER
jgi:hypothetical protein